MKKIAKEQLPKIEEASKTKSGFTLVELSLSIAFIGVLTLLVVFLINNTIVAYRRGMTLNLINTGGMDLVDEIRATVRNSPRRFDDDVAGTETPEVSWSESGEISGSSADGKVPAYGAFCTGRYSYIWQSGYYFEAGGPKMLRIVKKSGDTKEFGQFKLVKVKDSERVACKDGNLKVIDGVLALEGVEELDAEEIVLNNSLAIYDLSAGEPASNGGSLLYMVELTLGTTQGGVNLNDVNCKIDSAGSLASSLEYCAINKFSFAALATGGINK